MNSSVGRNAIGGSNTSKVGTIRRAVAKCCDNADATSAAAVVKVDQGDPVV